MAFYWPRYQESSNSGEDSVASVSFKETLTIDMPAGTPAGLYRIEWFYTWAYFTTSYNFKARVQVDDTTTVMTHTQEPTHTNIWAGNPGSGFGYVTLVAGTHSIDLDFCGSSASYTAYIRNRRLVVWKVDEMADDQALQQAYTAGQDSQYGTSWKETLTIDMPSSTVAGTYRIGWSYAWAHNSTSYSFNAQVQVDDTTTVSSHVQEPQDAATTQQQSVLGYGYAALTGGAHSIDLDFRAGYSTSTAYIEQRQLEVWRVDEIDDNLYLQQAYTEGQISNTGGSYPNWSTAQTITLASDAPAGNYRIGWSFGWAVNNTTSGWYVEDIFIDGVQQWIQFHQNPQDAASTQKQIVGGIMTKELTAGAHTIDMKFCTYTTTHTAYMDQRRLEVWRLPERTGGFTWWMGESWLDHLLKTGYTQECIGSAYIALFTADPGPEGSFTNEVSGGSYARRSLTFEFDDDEDGSVDSSSSVTFPTATASWGTVTHWAICDALTSGTQYYNDFIPIDRVREITTGMIVAFPAGTLTISHKTTLDMTTYTAARLLDQLFNDDGYTPKGGYLALFTADPGASGSFTNEISGNGYARVAVSWSDASGTPPVSSNSSAVDFPQLADSWGTITHVAICSASTAGQQIANEALTEPITPAPGDIVRFAAGELVFRLLVNP